MVNTCMFEGKDVIYNLEYFEKMLRQNSKTAEEISDIRWQWIQTIGPKTVLDYGSGCGFFRAFRPEGVEVNSYDVGPYPQTGIDLKLYDVVCFWDVFEHIDDFRLIEPILALSKHVALSIPVKPDMKNYLDWKHFKPSEHLHYWTQETLIFFFKKYGYNLIKLGTPECPPREDIVSFLFGRDYGNS